MRHTTTFRFDAKTLTLLQTLAESLHCSKTAIIEQALEEYAKRNTHYISPLLKHAGVLSDKEANTLLTAIQTHKHNKDENIEL